MFSLAAMAKDFTINKGEHYSSPNEKRLFRATKMSFQAGFNDSARYSFEPAFQHDQADTNKLYGFSDCGGSHIQNSARFGWRWFNNQLQIMAFTHVNGKFNFQQLGVAKLNRIHSYSIELSADKGRYIFNFDGKTVLMDRGCSSEKANGYTLQPYFGGNQPAPHDITITIGKEDQYANFSVDLLYPNPVKGETVNVDMTVEEDLEIGFEIFDLQGRLIQKIEPRLFSGPHFYKQHPLRLLYGMSNGLYLIRPYALVEGEEKTGMTFSKGDAMKLVIVR
jgi:hypothetical protein